MRGLGNILTVAVIDRNHEATYQLDSDWRQKTQIQPQTQLSIQFMRQGPRASSINTATHLLYCMQDY